MTNLDKQIKDIQKKVNGAISLKDAFNENFITKNTKFKTAEEFFSNSDLNIKTQKDLDDIENSILDKFVQENSNFENWYEMQKSAVVPIIQDRIHGKKHTPNISHTDPFMNIIINPDIIFV